MSVQAMTWAFSQDIPPKPKIVLLALANRANPETGKCWPGLAKLASETSVPERTLIRHIAALVRNGYVIKEKSRAPGGTQRNNTYYLVMDRDGVKFGEWQFTGATEAEDDDADEVCVVDDVTQDDVTEGAKMAVGPSVENLVQPTATGGTSPTAIGGSHQTTSETKLKTTASESSRSPKVGFSRRAQDDDIDRTRLERLAEKSLARHFVLKGSRAWTEWCEYRGRHGQIASLPEMWTTIEGQRRCGWYMPTLFPPEAEKESSEGSKATGPPSKITA